MYEFYRMTKVKMVPKEWKTYFKKMKRGRRQWEHGQIWLRSWTKRLLLFETPNR